jgi:hypothetical protein
MALFVARHQHAADRCPAADPQMGAMLLDHLSPPTAAAHDVTIQAEAVINDAHTLYLIAEAPDQRTLEAYLAPFAQVGSVEVMPSSSCAAVVNRGGCSAAVLP